MLQSVKRLFLAAGVLTLIGIAVAGDADPRHVRHELMEDVGKAAKPVGQMLRGQAEYDAERVRESLGVFRDVSTRFGDLFPEGSESGMDTEAAPAIWEDRAGFDAALIDWRNAVDSAIAANPATLDEARSALSPVFKSCKACHDGYRIDD